ncbi:MAG TPA: hypothetical protein VIM17_10070 [Jatrophihabitantaceae bacterium]|jgi:hypothetical protein
MSASRPVDPAFVERLDREWLAAAGGIGMTDVMVAAVARALLPAQRRLDAVHAEALKRGPA